MPTSYTSLLGLALPVTGELSGTWGDTVNNSITSLLDTAIAGAVTVSADTTLTTTDGASNQARSAIIIASGHVANITITAPFRSKIYTIINTSATYTVKIVGVGPTTGVTLGVSEKAQVAWNGSDFVRIGASGGPGVFSAITNTSLTSGRVVYSTTGGLETDSANLLFNGTTLTANTLNLTNALGTTYGGTARTVGNYSVYDNEIHVGKNGNDTTGDGTLINPVLTITKALTLIGSGKNTVIVHPGGYTENPTVSSTNTTIATSELTGANTIVYGTLTLSAAARVSGLKMTNLTITGSGNTYISNCTVDTQVVKSGTNYVEIINSELQCVSGIQISGSGVVSIIGNKCWAVAVSNASASVLIKDCYQVITPSVSAGTLQIDGSAIFAASPTSNAVTSSAGTAITLANSFVLNSAGTNVERVSLAGNYSILNLVYDKTNSTFAGTSLNAIDYFQYINADRVNFNGSTSGITGLIASAVAGTTSLTLPAATDTLVGRATTDTLTNKTLVAPALGTPASGNLSNCTNIPVNQATGNLPVANLNSGTSASATTFWRGDGTWGTPAGSGGTVSSVGISAPSIFTVTNSPVTGSGTLTLTYSGTALPTTSGGTGLTSFTSGGVVYASSGSALSTGSALTFDGTSLLVGSNTSGYGYLNVSRYASSPYSSLTITDNATPANAVGIYLRANGTSPAGISTAGSPLAFYTGGPATSERMRIETATGGVGAVGIGYSSLTSVGDNGLAVLGNVGIGTSSPANKLHVTVSAASTAVAAFYNTDTANGNGVYIKAGGANSGKYALAIDNAASSSLLYLDSSGNLGIGTTSPSNLLHIKAATNPVFRLEGATDSGYVDYNGTRLQLSAGGGATYFVAGNAERFRIGASGQLGIGGATYGTAGQVLTSGGSSAAPTWSTVTAGAGGSDTQIQYNSSGSLAGSANFTYNGTTIVSGANASTVGNLTGSFKSGRLLGTLTVAPTGASSPPSGFNYYMGYLGTTPIALSDANRVLKIGTLVNTTVSETYGQVAYGTTYGSKNAGMAFVSGTTNDALKVAINVAPLYTSDVNAVLLGYTVNGPRILIQNYALYDDSANVITSIADGHVWYGLTGGLQLSRTTGAFTPDTDNAQNLGGSSTRWAVVYAGTGTINTSDRNDKQDIEELSAAEQRAAVRVKGLIRKFRFKDSVVEKGDGARIHVGVIAQDVQDAFTAEGLDASRYGLFCSDTFKAVNGKPVKKDPLTQEYPEGAVDYTRLGVRYEELLAFVISAI